MFGWFKAAIEFFRGKAAETPEVAIAGEASHQPVPEPVAAQPIPTVEPGPAAPPKLNVTGPQLDFLKRGARHEAAHVVVGDAIQEDMEWVNVMGKPGVAGTRVHFNYSPEALQILGENWNGLSNKQKMTQKVIDLATCFVAGHFIENEKYPQIPKVSQRIQEAGEGIWGTLKKGPLDHHMVAWLLSLIDMRSVKAVVQLENRAKQMVDKERAKLKAIEEKLIEQGYIDGKEFKKIRGKLP